MVRYLIDLFKKTTFFIAATLSLFLSLPFDTLAGEQLSDREKKKIVYEMYAAYKKEFPDVKDISPQDAMELFRKREIVFLDTRREKEMNISKLPQAISAEEFFENTDR